MWRICRTGIAGNRLYGKVIALIIIMLLAEEFAPAMDAASAYAAGKAKNSVQLRIGGKKVTQKTYRMKQGAKKKLKAVVKKRKSVRFRSNNKNVVSVSKTGVIRAKKVGVAKITAVVKTGQVRKTAWMKVKVVSSETDKKTDTAERPDTTEPTVTEQPDGTIAPAATEETNLAGTPTGTPDVVTPVPTISPAPTVTEQPDGTLTTEEIKMINIQVGTVNFTAELMKNSSAEAFAEKLAEAPLTIEMHDYGNFEKVGALGFDLPTNNEQITTEPGDVILYMGNQITIYYDTNSWNFTRLGKIQGVTAEELKSALGAGNVVVTFSLV